MVSDAVLSAEEMLARAAANVRSGNTTANQSQVQRLLAQRETPIEDTVDISPVQKILQQQAAEAEETVSYFESDDYLQLKVQQLQGQLAIYSTLPGLDPSGSILSSIEAEIRDLIAGQQEKLNEILERGEDADAQLREQEAARAAELKSADDLLATVRGENAPDAISDEAQALLDSVRGSTVDTSA